MSSSSAAHGRDSQGATSSLGTRRWTSPRNSVLVIWLGPTLPPSSMINGALAPAAAGPGAGAPPAAGAPTPYVEPANQNAESSEPFDPKPARDSPVAALASDVACAACSAEVNVCLP